jgi:hypothetical protein
MIDTTCATKPGLDAARARMRFAAVLATAIRELAEAQPAPPRHNLPSRVALAANGAERR